MFNMTRRYFKLEYSIFDTKIFVLCRYQSLIVQEVKISREHKHGEKGGLLLGPQSLNWVVLVQLSQHTWYLQSGKT